MAFHLPQKTWTSFKAVVEERDLYMYQVRDDANLYEIIASDNGIIIECIIQKTNTTERNDYENNYQNDIEKCFANGNYEDDD